MRKFDELVRSQKVGFPVISSKFPMPRLTAWHPRMDENPPSPPFCINPPSAPLFQRGEREDLKGIF